MLRSRIKGKAKTSNSEIGNRIKCQRSVLSVDDERDVTLALK